MASYGFVYILTNEYMPSVVKIGMTERSPTLRAMELSGSTSVPAKFEVYAYFEVAECSQAEAMMHRMLDEYRANRSREFFLIPAFKAANILFHRFESLSHWFSDAYDYDDYRDEEEAHRAEVERERLLVQRAQWASMHDWTPEDIENFWPDEEPSNVVPMTKKVA